MMCNVNIKPGSGQFFGFFKAVELAGGGYVTMLLVGLPRLTKMAFVTDAI